jgi:GT2 family glycosyltransferase
MSSIMVSVIMTTYNCSEVLQPCLDSLRCQDCGPLELIIVDNASDDGTKRILKSLEQTCRVIYNQTNLGFAAAQNQALRHTAGEWVVTLNPDVLLSPNFISELIAAARRDPAVGMACGKLLRWRPGADPPRTNVIDSTGVYFVKNLRHLDRGAEELDVGQYDQSAYVFGATGAAALYNRKMIEDISVAGEFYDEDFFSYREDADVSWRAHLLGWRCVYTPRAVAWHVRRVTPSRRRELPLFINWHSIKNRFLMRAKNISARLYLRFFLPVTLRDTLILGYALLADRRLLSAFRFLWKRRKAIWAKRQWIQSRRRVSDSKLAPWFSNRPVSFTLPPALRSETADPADASGLERDQPSGL